MKTCVALLLVLAIASTTLSAPFSGNTTRACPANPRAPGKYRMTIRYDGDDRDYILYVPSTYPSFTSGGRPVPLFFVLHGFSNNIEETYTNFGIQKLTEENNGAIAVVPAGFRLSWNGGECCPPATFWNKKDVNFIRELARIVSAEFCIDAGRVFAGGYSNGGFMSHRLGCEAADLIRGVGPVAGHLSDESDFACRPVKNMPVIHFHGTADTVITYNKAPTSWKRWGAINSCSTTPRVTYQKGSVKCETLSGCANNAESTLCTITNGPHAWPGCSYYGNGQSGSGSGCDGATPDIYATPYMWEYFIAHSTSGGILSPEDPQVQQQPEIEITLLED
eukprot:TRINITY_DN687_c0_g13_i1.p1 TRINITY_DN687_c0_g13~~TRINITY_DN687_c0_g13_i1.p1  ORF type:complete len:335 (-),score=57.45 TRINITY_DN687_c0_g13_i1:255-1259(-)